MIQYPIRVGQFAGASFAFIRDSSDRVIAGGLKREDAEEIVNALNAQPKRKSEDDENKLHRNERTERERQKQG